MVTSTISFTAFFRGNGKYAKKGYVVRKLPGYDVYELNKSLSHDDAKDYHQRQLSNGQYLVFIGLDWDERGRVEDFVTRYTSGQMKNVRRYSESRTMVPTWEQTVNRWCDRNHLPHNCLGRYWNIKPYEVYGKLETAKQIIEENNICDAKWRAENWSMIKIIVGQDPVTGVALQEWQERICRSDLPWIVGSDNITVFVYNNKQQPDRQRQLQNLRIAEDLETSLSTACWTKNEQEAKQYYEQLTGMLALQTHNEYYKWDDERITLSVYDRICGLHCIPNKDGPVSIVRAVDACRVVDDDFTD